MTSVHPPFSEIALEILCERYLRRDEAGDLVETPEGMLERVARAVAQPAKIFRDDKYYWEARKPSICPRLARLALCTKSSSLHGA